MKIQRLEVHDERMVEATKDIENNKAGKPLKKGSKQVGTIVIDGVPNILVQHKSYKDVNAIHEAPVIKCKKYLDPPPKKKDKK